MNKGIGYMISFLGGNKETVEVHNGAIGKVITKAAMEKDELHLSFQDGTGIRFLDDGQSCCESRFMTCDDDLSVFPGSIFNGAEIRDAPNMESSYGEHEVQFLVVNTSKGQFTVASHNEHNGYYGGIALIVRETKS